MTLFFRNFEECLNVVQSVNKFAIVACCVYHFSRKYICFAFAVQRELFFLRSRVVVLHAVRSPSLTYAVSCRNDIHHIHLQAPVRIFNFPWIRLPYIILLEDSE